MGAEFKIEEPGWRARIAREEREYLLARTRYAEAAEVLRASVSASDEAIRRAANDAYSYSNKGVALRSLGDLLAAISRYEEAEGAFTDAVTAFDPAPSELRNEEVRLPGRHQGLHRHHEVRYAEAFQRAIPKVVRSL